MLSTLGLDPITVQLLGRWGSNAVLTYIAESPLSSLSDRLKAPLAERTMASAINGSSLPAMGNFDDRAHYKKAISDCKEATSKSKEMMNMILDLTKQVGDMQDKLDGMSSVLDQTSRVETWDVFDSQSQVRHRSLVNLSNSPSTWSTICGWKFDAFPMQRPGLVAPTVRATCVRNATQAAAETKTSHHQPLILLPVAIKCCHCWNVNNPFQSLVTLNISG